ncbi:MAG: sigma-70 family RNA polymerase sigma factor [Acidobacteriota bacterium]
MNEADGQALLGGARGGDPEAVEALLRWIQPRVYRFGLRMCGDEEDAKDVLQDTLLAAARNLQGLRTDGSLSTWLYTLTRNFCIKKRRRGKFEPSSPLALEAAAEVRDPAPLPDASAARNEVTAELERALRGLTPSQREVLLLRDVEGLTAPEVARVLGIGERAVKSRLHRARAALRSALERPIPARANGCPDVEGLFSKDLEGDLSPSICASMERHLANCSRCRSACDGLKRTLRRCAEAPQPVVPDDLAQRVRQQVHALARRSPGALPTR